MRKQYTIISLLLVVIPTLLFEIYPTVRKEFQEDRLVENISAALFFISFLYSLSLLTTHKNVRYKKTLILIMSLGLVGFLDELSFGHRMFDLNMPIVLGTRLDAVHDLVAIALVPAWEYEYVFISLFFLIAIVFVYILIYKRIILNKVINSILLDAPYSFLAFFVFYISVAVLVDVIIKPIIKNEIGDMHYLYQIFRPLEEIVEMIAALALVYCCLSIRYTLNLSLVGLALVAGTAIGTIYAPDQLAWWKTYFYYGRKAYLLADYAEADEQFKAALKVAEGFGAHPRLATSLNSLARFYRAQGRYTDAEPLYQRALAIREKALGPDHPAVAASLNNLAELYRAQSRYAEAEPLLQRTLDIREKGFGPDHPAVAAALAHYAALLRETDRDVEAEMLEARAEAIRAKHAKENP